jgi:hypothetical protein
MSASGRINPSMLQGGSRRALVVEDAGADLEQEAGAAGCAAHLLFLDYALADDLVDRGTR